MSGALIETTLELCAASLRDIKARIWPLFTQSRSATLPPQDEQATVVSGSITVHRQSAGTSPHRCRAAVDDTVVIDNVTHRGHAG